jgi:opacity protein-like surface antigen
MQAVRARTEGLGFDSASIFGIGLGYQFNSWLRFDATGEYRGRSNFHGADHWVDAAGRPQANNYSGSKSETLLLVNAYADLGTWWGITPFIGVGIGSSYNMTHSFRDDGIVNIDPAIGAACGGQCASITYAADKGKWNLAWAAHAGLAYRVTPAFAVELAYRYVDLGSAVTGLPNISYEPGFAGQNTWTMKGLTSHDLKLGVRWMIAPEPMYAPPLITKG